MLLLLAQALHRLTPRALEVFDGTLTAFQLAIAAIWTVFMLYAEAWRGFHLKFSPRVVARSSALVQDGRTWLALCAPAVAMGLLHGTPRRLLVSRLLFVGIVLLVVAVRFLPDPWRAIVDLGVVVGLGAGALSIVWHALQALNGNPPQIAADFPDQTAAA
ncbi:MAG: hypothetical protein KTR31_14970 [Myxococcales bacterium]|nr:hypothetical protein [Myxococcales bacterium]